MSTTFRRIRFYTYIGLTALGVLVILAYLVWALVRDLPEAPRQVKVYAPLFAESTDAAMDILNTAAGCTFLVRGSQDDHAIKILDIDEVPCGAPFHPGLETGHSATAYRCPQRGTWEINVEMPGDIHTMVCIAAHEIMHTLGMPDSSRGLMNQRYCPSGRIWPSDSETAKLKEQCK